MDGMLFRLLLGHFFGDFAFQNKAMMFGKSKKGWEGIFWCTLHCVIYTAIVCLFLWTLNPWIIAAVFISHWPIDRWSLAGKWMKLVKSRELGKVYTIKEIDAIFYGIVYTVTDNTFHIFLMWLALLLLL